MNSSIDIVQLNLLLLYVSLLELPQAIVLHLVPQLITICLGLVSLRLAENAGQHAVLKISYFALVLDDLLTFPAV